MSMQRDSPPAAGAETPLEASAVIVVRNGEKTIVRQLRALADQRQAPPFEIIVVDNASSDGTVAVTQQWAAAGLGAATALTIVDASKHTSIPYARNLGAMAARGRLLLWCDADDAVDPHWVRTFAARVFEGGASGCMRAWRPDGSPAPDVFPSGLQQTNYLPHGSNCNMAIVRSDFLRVGGYDESFPSYGCEDVDISWRLLEAGLPMEYVPEATIDFTVSTRTRQVRKTFLAAKARIAVALRHPQSLGTETLSAGVFVVEATRQTCLLPMRLARPGQVPRSRWLRNAVAAWGRFAGYWTYAVRRKPEQRIEVAGR